MNRIHKIIHFPLIKKLYLLFFFFIVYGWYKNGLLPYLEHYYSMSHVFLILFYPICGYGIGALFDFLFKNKYPFPNRFYGLLFSLIVPISTNICLFVLSLTLLLFLNTFWISKKDSDLNFIVLGKLLLVVLLYTLHSYFYANLLEESQMFVYSYLDGIFGHNESGLFTSCAFLSLVSLGILSFDAYYKKEIPFYSYGIYLLTLVLYAFLKSDMNFILSHMFSSTILFVIVFIAPLSSFSPYSKKRVAFYSILLGITILPFSLLTNFFEGVYISLILVNLLLICLNRLQISLIKRKIS